MPHVTFESIQLLGSFSRPALAQLWGYSGYQALARGVVTPAGQRLIILFVTKDKQQHLEQYSDRLEDGRLYWDGPTDHYAEDRMVAASSKRDEIHLFYRERHHSEFAYHGRLSVEEVTRNTDGPSRFVFQLVNA